MPDRHEAAGHRSAGLPNPEQARVDFASARADAHATRELFMLELAVLTSDDVYARRLELRAHEAYCDALAITEEHALDR